MFPTAMNPNLTKYHISVLANFFLLLLFELDLMLNPSTVKTIAPSIPSPQSTKNLGQKVM